MQTTDRWRKWRPSAEILGERLEQAPTKLTKDHLQATFVGFDGSVSGNPPDISSSVSDPATEERSAEILGVLLETELTKPSKPTSEGFDGDLSEAARNISFPVEGDPYEFGFDLSGRPVMPAGVRLISYNLLPPPVQLSQHSTVVNTELFVAATLVELDYCLMGKTWQAGNWGVAQLLDRLCICGCVVEIEDDRKQVA